MNNSASTTSATILQYDRNSDVPFKVLWLCGISISALCLLIQVTIFVLIRGSRKADEKTLSQITFTRILTTSCEYYILYARKRSVWLNDVIFGLYMTSDFAIVCWMFVFTKHLYDKIVIVFNAPKPNLIVATIAVWAISSTFGIVAIYLLKYHPNYFVKFCDLFYVVLKFVLLTFNSLIYLRVFYVAFKTNDDNSKNVKSTVKTAFVAFLLITTTCIQILVTDIIALISGAKKNELLIKSFCVINSFHAVPLTAIFLLILKGKMRQSISKTVSVRLTELMT